MDPLSPGDPRHIGPYRLAGRLGVGGMGQVFLGWSPGGRKVAVKVIRPDHAGDVRFRARFAREVEAARRVGGFHTAQVVDADPQADPPWLVTAFIEGPSLLELVKSRGPLDANAVRALGAGLAEGLSAIHGCGLVHRDLKPGNVIMSADGPRIIDFGIARDANASTLTATGTVMGTFSFMSPEQVRADQAGPASDLFSLGCVLAHAATGHGPFDAPAIPAIVHRIINEPPRLDGITGDLQLTITACLAKNPADRPTVPDLLTRLTDPGAGPKADPAAIVAAAAAPARPPQPHPPRPVGPLAIKRTEPSTMDLADERQPTKLEPSPSGMSRRALLLGAGAVAGAAVAVAVPAVIFWPRSNASGGSGGPIAVVAMTFSTDGKTLIAVGGDGADSVWRCDVTTGRSTVTRLGTTGNVLAVALGPGGKTLARSEGNTIQHWNMATGSSVVLKGHTEGVRDVSFNRGGTVLASVGNDKTVRIWDLTSGNTTAFFRNNDTDAPSALAFSPDGTLLAVGSSDGNNVRLLNTKPARLKATLKEFNYIRTVEFSPDGRTLAIGGSGTRLWNLDPGSHTKSFSDQADTGVNAVFSPDGKTVASGGFKELQGGAASRTGVRIWDVTSSRLIRSLRPAAPPLAFSPDGRTLATSGDKVRLWNVTTGALVRTL